MVPETAPRPYPASARASLTDPWPGNGSPTGAEFEQEALEVLSDLLIVVLVDRFPHRIYSQVANESRCRFSILEGADSHSRGPFDHSMYVYWPSVQNDEYLITGIKRSHGFTPR